MKKFLIIPLLALFLAVAQPAAAQTLSPAKRAQMLQQIQLLQMQVVALQEQLARLHAAGPSRSFEPHDSRLYDGSFESIYEVQGITLQPHNLPSVRYGDKVLWDTYVDLVGEDFVRDYLVEFRIFNDNDNVMGGFIEQNYDLDWILAINRFDDNLATEHDDPFMIELLLHESGHIIFFEDSWYQERFMDEFWEGWSIERHYERIKDASLERRGTLGENYYENNETEFVTAYAATSPTEDLVESFVEFVISDKKPRGSNTKDDKVRFFYDFKDLREWRAELRDSGLI